MKPFEIPYNFDPELLNHLGGVPIDSLYVAPHVGDNLGARRFYSRPGTEQILVQPADRDEYEDHVNLIASRNIPMSILLQVNQPVEYGLIEYYACLGFKEFIVGHDETAKRVKEICKDFITTASMTRKLTFHEINTLDPGTYDKVILFHPFNRSLDTIKQLPKTMKYVLLVNNMRCSVLCDATHHWFADSIPEDVAAFQKCPLTGKPSTGIYVPPHHLELFDQYIDVYKLEGREFDTELLTYDINTYMKREPLYHVIEQQIPYNPQYAVQYYNALKKSKYLEP